MVAHVVLFTPKPGLDAGARQRMTEVFQDAVRNIPSIRRAHIGRRVVLGRPYEQLMAADYQFAAILEFDSVTDLRSYLDHDAHVTLASHFFEIFDTALMYDFDMIPGTDSLVDLHVDRSDPAQ